MAIAAVSQARRATVAIVLALLLLSPRQAVADQASLWRALESGGHVGLLRHALAPGTGDPSDFVIGDCRTQRNLSAEGRQQAARIGAQFRSNGIVSARVFSSQWCRCLETAEHLELGPVEELPVLNSFYRRSERKARQTAALQHWLAAQKLDRPILLVTHQVNITALTGVYPKSGELVVVRRNAGGDLSVVGSIATQ